MQYSPTHVFSGFVGQKPKLFPFIKCQFGSGLFIKRLAYYPKLVIISLKDKNINPKFTQTVYS